MFCFVYVYLNHAGEVDRSKLADRQNNRVWDELSVLKSWSWTATSCLRPWFVQNLQSPGHSLSLELKIQPLKVMEKDLGPGKRDIVVLEFYSEKCVA